MRVIAAVGLVSLVAGAAMAQPVPVPPKAEYAAFDDGQYADDAAAQAAWEPMTGTAPVSVAALEGRKVLRMPCNFAGTKIERASWDRKVTLDLTTCQGIRFKFFSKDTSPISHFSLYFQSGEGWYASSFSPATGSAWNTITIDKAGTRQEGKPAGWGQISTIRLSAWRGGDVNTELYVCDFGPWGQLGADALVAVVRGESAVQKLPNEARRVEQFTQGVVHCLREVGISCGIISDLDVTAERLKSVKLAILPHNPGMPDNVADELVKYVNGGGKLLIFYTVPGKLRPVVKVEGGAHVQAKHPGFFSTIRFADRALPGVPATAGQRSWNISEAKPVPGASRVLAEWLDDKGQPTSYAAIVASDNCMVMTQVLLPDDPVNKRCMMLAMVGHFMPELWRQSAERSIASIGVLAGYKDFDDAARQIQQTSKNDAKVAAGLAAIRQLRDEAKSLCSQGKYPESAQKAAEAGQRVTEAFCMAQQPLPGEARLFWCHSAFGVEGMTWDAAIKNLADNGFTAILPNMLWGGSAYYPSKVLPLATNLADRGDQIAQCVAACKKYGVQIHVWKVNWKTGYHVPKEFAEKMRREGRVQFNSKGQQGGESNPWLCPSHPDNQKLEIDSMVEVARNYDVDGVHFDYIRYPDNDHCFCPGCKERFQKACGVQVQNWPKDVQRDGPFAQQWLDWRRSNITAVVKGVAEQARAIKPKIKISAAVFRNWAVDRDGVGQDWKLWCDSGYVDFVCPMNYTDSDQQFDNWIAIQKKWAGKVPVYPGIGAYVMQAKPDRVIGQILITRRHQTGGFTIFNYGPAEAKDLVPMLGLGITAKR